MHGYEMIQEIAERSGGAWKPSPGSVYPTLQLLEDEGLIASESEGGKKLFALTEAGRTAAEEGPEAPWEEASRGVDWEALNDIRQAGFGLMEAFGQVWKTGSKEQREKALAVIGDARKKLYLILADERAPSRTSRSPSRGWAQPRSGPDSSETTRWVSVSLANSVGTAW